MIHPLSPCSQTVHQQPRSCQPLWSFSVGLSHTWPRLPLPHTGVKQAQLHTGVKPVQVRREPGLLHANLQSPGPRVPTEAMARMGRGHVLMSVGIWGPSGPQARALPLQVLRGGTWFCVDKDKSSVEGTGFLLHDFKCGLQSCAE